MSFVLDFYCALHKHANSKVHKPPSQLRFSLPSIIITTTSNEPWNTETHKTVRNPPITNHKPWPFEPVKVKFCSLRGPLTWLTAAKNAMVSWLLNFKIRICEKRSNNAFRIKQWLSAYFWKMNWWNSYYRCFNCHLATSFKSVKGTFVLERLFCVKYLFGEAELPKMFFCLRTTKNFQITIPFLYNFRSSFNKVLMIF